MNLSETALITIAGMVITYVLHPFINRFLSRRADAVAAVVASAAAELTLQQAAQMTVANVLTALKEQEETNKELRQGMETLEEALNIKNKYIERLEAEIEETRALKSYVRSLIEFLRGKGVDYPPPPAGLLDTDPKIKKVNK